MKRNRIDKPSFKCKHSMVLGSWYCKSLDSTLSFLVLYAFFVFREVEIDWLYTGVSRLRFWKYDDGNNYLGRFLGERERGSGK